MLGGARKERQAPPYANAAWSRVDMDMATAPMLAEVLSAGRPPALVPAAAAVVLVLVLQVIRKAPVSESASERM